MGLQENIRNEPVRQLNLRQPVVCSPETTLRTAIERMRECRLGCAIIVDQEHKPVGMFTESMLTGLIARGSVAWEDPVSCHMAEQWPWVKESDPIADILAAMQLKNVRFVCVVDEEGKLTALAGQKSLMEYVAEHFPGQVMVQRIGCPPCSEREGA